jgi:chorismate lyase/3-hydroxybenzoate synthase
MAVDYSTDAAGAAPTAPRVAYRQGESHALLATPGTLALIGFGPDAPDSDDPRYLRVALSPLDRAQVYEHWTVDAPLRHGREGDVRWCAGGGWLFAATEVDETEQGGVQAAAAGAYADLCGFLARHPGFHWQRLWNYLGDINAGVGDDERYKRFCVGRAEGMHGRLEARYPAATAVGHHGRGGLLQVYGLAATSPGTRVENPRQVSAWQYPRQYGPVPPSFARAMRLPANDALAISGTAAISGHESRHAGDLGAQLEETLANLRALLAAGGMPARFDAGSPLKVYVRHPEHAGRVADFLDRHASAAPRRLLHGDICRTELLVEIDGWRYA